MREKLPKSIIFMYECSQICHCFCHAIDRIKIEPEIGWKIKEKFGEGFRVTIIWCLKQEGKLFYTSL